MVGACVLDVTRSVEISDLVTHDFFAKSQLYGVIATLHVQTLGNLVTIITSRKKYSAFQNVWGGGQIFLPLPLPSPPHLKSWG